MADGGVGDRCFMKDACDQPCVVDCSHPKKVRLGLGAAGCSLD